MPSISQELQTEGFALEFNVENSSNLKFTHSFVRSDSDVQLLLFHVLQELPVLENSSNTDLNLV
jgi:hypothetical protein